MNVAFFGSSLVSAYWNGAATYYRGIIRAMHERGHKVTFYEPDAYDRQSHRDMANPDWAEVVVYENNEAAARRCLRAASDATLIVKASGVGVFDELLEAEVLNLKKADNAVVFWDVDAPATLERMEQDLNDAFRAAVPRYDAVLTYGGGMPVIAAYEGFGARTCRPIYNGFDPSTHYPAAPDPRFRVDLGFLGNRLPDREARVEEFFLRAAALSPGKEFMIGGSGWGDKAMPGNVRYLGHVYTEDHNAFNCSPKAVLNISRDSMARYGFSPATRVFEAMGAGACMITDAWEGIEMFFEPGSEILVAQNGDEVAGLVNETSSVAAAEIGRRAYARALSEHTYASRVNELERVLRDLLPAKVFA